MVERHIREPVSRVDATDQAIEYGVGKTEMEACMFRARLSVIARLLCFAGIAALGLGACGDMSEPESYGAYALAEACTHGWGLTGGHSTETAAIEAAVSMCTNRALEGRFSPSPEDRLEQESVCRSAAKSFTSTCVAIAVEDTVTTGSCTTIVRGGHTEQEARGNALSRCGEHCTVVASRCEG